MAQADSMMNSSEEVVPAENLQHSTITEVAAAAAAAATTSVETQSTSNKEIIPARNYTTSATALAVKKTRKTIHWICTFQLMNPPPGAIPERASDESVFLDDEAEVVDAFLREAFESFYNRDTAPGKDRRNLVRCLLGGRYVWHPSSGIVAGVLVLYARLRSVTPSLNAHLRLEKARPLEAPSWGRHHALYFGDCYAIHVEDEVCVQGNSLRALLRNWVNEEFFSSLHWIVPPSMVESFNASSMDNIARLLRQMKVLVQESPRKTIRGDPAAATPVATASTPKGRKKRRRDDDLSNHRKIWEYMEVTPGKTYLVKADHWAKEEDDLPLTADGFPDMDTYRYVAYVKDKGGVVVQVSLRRAEQGRCQIQQRFENSN